jgi:transcription termination/antitermination protein NusA
LSRFTGAGSRDVITDEENDRLIFIVNNGEMGLAIGKQGANIRKAAETPGSDAVRWWSIRMIPPSSSGTASTPRKRPRSSTLTTMGTRSPMWSSGTRIAGLAIGKAGKNLSRTKMIAQREHNIQNIILE